MVKLTNSVLPCLNLESEPDKGLSMLLLKINDLPVDKALSAGVLLSLL